MISGSFDIAAIIEAPQGRVPRLRGTKTTGPITVRRYRDRCYLRRNLDLAKDGHEPR